MALGEETHHLADEEVVEVDFVDQPQRDCGEHMLDLYAVVHILLLPAWAWDVDGE